MILAILQARMSSNRLPGKVMRPLLGQPMIGRQLELLGACHSIDQLVVATSLETSDDPLAAYCEKLGVRVFRGSLEDVLGRFVGAANQFGPATHVVRLTADCPLTEPSVIDACVRLHIAEQTDYTSNTLDRSFPVGLDIEVMTIHALHAAAREARTDYEREHVTPFIWQRPHHFRIAQLLQTPDVSDLRWTVDTLDDFAFVERVYSTLGDRSELFDQEAVMALPFNRRVA